MTQETPSISEDNPKFDPFRRNDRYGRMGLAKQPPLEQARLGFFKLLVFPLRALSVLFCVLCCWLVCLIGKCLPGPARNPFVAGLGKGLCRMALLSCGFFSINWVDVAGKKDQDGEFCAIVSNHTSWVDILVYMTRWFPSFVAKDGTKRLPLIGMISQMLGCIYVKREAKDAADIGVSGLVKKRMQETSKTGSKYRRMLLFPEGTTTNGRFLLPFKTGAFLAGLPVQPAIVRYTSDWVSVAWETIPGVRHLILMLCAPWHSITVYVLPVYRPSEEEKSSPELYAGNVREYMLKYSQLQPSDSRLEDKRQYHNLLSS